MIFFTTETATERCALSYEPAEVLSEEVHSHADFDEVAADCAALSSSDVSRGLDYLFAAGGSSGYFGTKKFDRVPLPVRIGTA